MYRECGYAVDRSCNAILHGSNAEDMTTELRPLIHDEILLCRRSCHLAEGLSAQVVHLLIAEDMEARPWVY